MTGPNAYDKPCAVKIDAPAASAPSASHYGQAYLEAIGYCPAEYAGNAFHDQVAARARALARAENPAEVLRAVAAQVQAAAAALTEARNG